MKSNTLNKDRFYKYLLILSLFLLAIYSLKIASKSSDFTVFLKSAQLISQGQTPYNEWLFVSEGNYCLYFYSPFWALLLIPFSYLPEFWPQYCWLLLNCWFLYRVGALLISYVTKEGLTNQHKLILVITALLSARFILYNFEMIQMTLFLLWGGLEALRLSQQKRYIIAGALLAFVINVKILPIVLLPYLIFRKQFATAVVTVFFSFVYLFIPALFLGWDTNMGLLTDWWHVINPSNSEHQLEADLGPHSLTALIPTLLTPTEGIIPIQRNVASLSVENALLVLNIVRLFLIGLTLYFLKWTPFRTTNSKGQQLYEISYLFLITPLIFPHQQKYAFLLAAPALFYIVCSLILNNGLTTVKRKITIAVLILSFILMTATTDGIVGRELNEIFQHFKLLTYGTLLLIPALILVRPSTKA